MVKKFDDAQSATTSSVTGEDLGALHTKPEPTQQTLSHSLGFDKAFGLTSISSMAGEFVRLIAKAAEENENLRKFRYGVVDQISPDLGSAAYVAGEYNGSWLYGIIFFEKGDTIRVVVNGQTETYYTVASLLTSEALATLQKSIADKYSLNDLHYMTLNAVPDLGKQMDLPWAINLMGQLLMGIFGRAPGFLGSMLLTKTDRFSIAVAGVDDGVAIDGNGHPQRADFGVYVSHQSQNQEQNTPTLLDTQASKEYPRVRATGFVNLRFTGLKPTQNGVEDLKQLQGEVVVSLMDSQLEGTMAPYERQLVALAGFADVAAVGGWRDTAVAGFNKSDRKFSAVAGYLNWGAAGKNVDVAKLDGNKEAINGALELFCPKAAALVVSHRAANGLGGLSTLLAEIAVGNVSSLSQLLSLLDGMFKPEGDKGTWKFRNSLAQALGVTSIECKHIVAAAVPTVAGVYTGNGQKRSYSDMDLVSVCSYLGDKQQDVMRYMHAQSYANRELGEKQQRMYLLKVSAAMYGNRGGKSTGEGLDMAINPIFAKTLLTKVRETVGAWQLNGVNAYDSAANSLFFNNGNADLVLSGNGNVASGADFGLGLTNNSFNF